MNSESHLILATAGHVDHGKSSLVKALTGTDPDRLPEEKARGITIDLGFAQLSLEVQEPAPTRYTVGIIDVPGHEDFVKNMVAGVGSIDLALLVVAADDGWMPQTEEHFQILSYLGVTRGLVALTKADLAPGNLQESTDAVRRQLQGSSWSDAPIVPTTLTDAGSLRALQTALAQVLSSTPLPRDVRKPRLPVDRAFALRGIGTVVTGTLSGGTLTRGQLVHLQPPGAQARIRSIQSHQQELASVGPGTRTALALSELTPPTKGGMRSTIGSVQRGEVVTLGELGPANSTFDVLIERSSRLEQERGVPARRLPSEARVQIHHGTGHVTGRLILLDQKELNAGDRGLAQVRLDQPLFAFVGDRFIVRDWSEQTTLAGGCILETDSARRHFRRSEQRIFLQKRAESPNDAFVAVQTEVERQGSAQRRRLLVASNFGPVEVDEAVNALQATGALIPAGEFLVHTACWNEWLVKATSSIELYHQQHPQERGLPVTQLRASFESDSCPDEVYERLLETLSQRGFQRDNTIIRRLSHRPALPAHLASAGAALKQELATQPLDPPSRKELASSAERNQALRFLIEAGLVVELGTDLVLMADVFGRATQAVQNHLRAHGKATVSDLRKVVGASRRVVVPLLEKMDRDGLTRREGDFRILRRPQA